MRPFPTWIILWSHKVKPPSFCKSQAEEQQELRKFTALRHQGSTRNPHWIVLIFLLFHSPCSSSRFSICFFQPSTLLTWLIHILHLQLPSTLKATLTNIPKRCSLLAHHLSHLNKRFCESATAKGASSLSPVMLHSNHWPCTFFIPNQCSSLHWSHPRCWSFPAAMLLSCAPAGKRSVVCEQSRALLLPLKSSRWLQALCRLNLPAKQITNSLHQLKGRQEHISKGHPAKWYFSVHLCLALYG